MVQFVATFEVYRDITIQIVISVPSVSCATEAEMYAMAADIAKGKLYSISATLAEDARLNKLQLISTYRKEEIE